MIIITALFPGRHTWRRWTRGVFPDGGGSPLFAWMTVGLTSTPWLCSLLRSGLDFPGGSGVEDLPAQQETRVRARGQEIPWRRKRQSTPAFLPGKCHGQRSLAGYSPWGPKESDTTERLAFSLWMSNHKAKRGIESCPPTTSIYSLSETWAVRSPSPGTKGMRWRGGARSPCVLRHLPSGKYICLLFTERHSHLEFLRQSGSQHRLGEPELACPTPGSHLGTDAVSHSGTKWNIRVLHSWWASPLP